MRYSYSILILFLVLACNDDNKQASEQKPGLSDELTGEWRNTYLKVTMFTHNNTDTSSVLEVTEDNWEEKLKSRTIQTNFYLSITM